MRIWSSPRPLEGSVVVLVGASSGVGRLCARAFTERGADVVLAARSGDDLEATARSCSHASGAVLSVPTDVTHPDEIEALMARTLQWRGRVDTWVNLAAVLIAGTPGGESVDQLEQLVRTNVLGPALASRVVLPQLREQRSGVIIDVSSMLGVVPNPLVPYYVMSKFAVRGLSLSLHHLCAPLRDVRVCAVLPGPIDTPMFERADNHTSHHLRAISPALAPERVAAAIVSCARRPRRQVPVGATSRLILLAHRVSPRATEWTVARAAAALLLGDERSETDAPTRRDGRHPYRSHGGYRLGALRRRLGESFGRHRWSRA